MIANSFEIVDGPYLMETHNRNEADVYKFKKLKISTTVRTNQAIVNVV